MSVGIVNSVHDPEEFGQISLSKTNLSSPVTHAHQYRDEYYTADSLNTLFETIPKTCKVEFLQEAGFIYLI